jgi:hypothetical protein
MQQGGKSQRHSFQVRRPLAVIPLLCNGSARIGLLARRGSPFQLGGPFGFCAFALLTPLWSLYGLRPVLLDQQLGSLEIALKRTRPRQCIYLIGRYSMTEGDRCQEGRLFKLVTIIFISWAGMDSKLHVSLGKFLIVHAMISRYHTFHY